MRFGIFPMERREIWTKPFSITVFWVERVVMRFAVPRLEERAVWSASCGLAGWMTLQAAARLPALLYAGTGREVA